MIWDDDGMIHPQISDLGIIIRWIPLNILGMMGLIWIDGMIQ
jgi:hypothetical protein